MKINILYNFNDGPWGGANQFLKILKNKLESENKYEENIKNSDVVIYNSYHNLLKAIDLKIKYPEKIFVHRLGPYFYLHRDKKWKMIDSLIIKVSNSISDLIIFQSKWSHKKSLKFSLQNNKAIEIIGNAADETIFKRKNKESKGDVKVRLITDSWSSNFNKGFEYYQFLDNNLDFSKYQMTFIGNSPIKFKNIKSMPPLPSSKLAEELNKNDIFISAVQDDAYSNSIVEALACGLPVVALNSGGNAEIIGNGGELFENENEMINKIEIVQNNYDKYRKNISIKSIEDITNTYLSAIEKITRSKNQLTGPNKASLYCLYLKTFLTIWIFKILQYAF
ncbi:MAG: glycosyltransferase [Candidatus Pacebacteria bacterium]|nr:glycosyltransferase [Candidatus Paceibacterota bacterium]